MSNCLFLLNDGTSFIELNNVVDFLIMNDNTCGATLQDGAFAATGGAEALFVNASLTQNPVPFEMTGTGTALFRGAFGIAPPRESPAGGSFKVAWDSYRQDAREREVDYLDALNKIRATPEHKQLVRRRAMYQEMLDDKPYYTARIKIQKKMIEIDERIKWLERQARNDWISRYH